MVSAVKMEAIDPAEKKVKDYIYSRLYAIHFNATRLMRKGASLSAHAYAPEEERKSNRFLAYSKWDEPGPLQ